jgi:predicted Rossmann fold flavoprotein
MGGWPSVNSSMSTPPEELDPHLAIVGGGAAGLAAAIFAAEAAGGARRIVILDGAKSLGAKILVAGGGRCNVTHDEIRPDDFNGPRNIVRNVLAAFDEAAAVRWFASMGVELKREETGKLFPVTDSARTVLNALLRRCEELGVVIRTSSRVTRVAREAAGFVVEHAGGGAVRARRIVLSTGGRSLPRSGSDGFGWAIARSLGHTVTPTFAALAPLVLDAAKMFHVELAGVSHDVELSTFVAGKRVDRRTGSLLWTHFGISGPVVMDASRHWVIPHESGEPTEMRANLLPGQSFEAAERWLIEQAAARAKASALNVVAARLPERVAAAVLKFVGVEPGAPCGQLSRDARRALVHALTALPLPVVGHRGWNYAEVTAGGVPLAEVDFRTMESRIVPGLFLAGEILDCDGRIGGFNFQWAWATGYLAGRGAMREARP